MVQRTKNSPQWLAEKLIWEPPGHIKHEWTVLKTQSLTAIREMSKCTLCMSKDTSVCELTAWKAPVLLVLTAVDIKFKREQEAFYPNNPPLGPKLLAVYETLCFRSQTYFLTSVVINFPLIFTVSWGSVKQERSWLGLENFHELVWKLDQ